MTTEIFKNKWFWIILVALALITLGIYIWQKGITIAGLTIGGQRQKGGACSSYWTDSTGTHMCKGYYKIDKEGYSYCDCSVQNT